jgi:hypothetical protein
MSSQSILARLTLGDSLHHLTTFVCTIRLVLDLTSGEVLVNQVILDDSPYIHVYLFVRFCVLASEASC